MRIAYVANYQGPSFVSRRPCLHNLSLAARVKIQLIAELLTKASHEVEIISQGQLEPRHAGGAPRRWFYPAFSEEESFHPDIPVHYLSALDVRYLTGFWESSRAKAHLRARHRRNPFDVVILYNMQRAQVGCGPFAVQRLQLPIILQYEDDAFVDVHGRAERGRFSGFRRAGHRRLLRQLSGGTGVSPYLLSQMPDDVPKLLLRGVVSPEIARLAANREVPRSNRVVFSGTHEGTQGLEQLVVAWKSLALRDWELHIAGQGPLTPSLQRLAHGDSSVVFHGLLDRKENARLLCSARIGVNPQDPTSTPGNVFPFKIAEYLAAGLHVISTRRGPLEPELEAGVTYIDDNATDSIALGLKRIIVASGSYPDAQQAALAHYGPDAVAASLNALLQRVVSNGPRSPK